MFDQNIGITFNARLEQLRYIANSSTIGITLPPDIAIVFLQNKIKRAIVTINGISLSRGLLSDGNGGLYLITALMTNEMQLGYGAMVEVHIKADPAPDFVELPEELEAVLDQDEAFASRFNTFTPGKRRSLAKYVLTAKSVDTRIKRALELAHKTKNYLLYGDLRPKQQSSE